MENTKEDASASKGMQKLEIYRFQAESIKHALRIVSNRLNCHTKKTCLDREVMEATEIIENVLNERINQITNRITYKSTMKDSTLTPEKNKTQIKILNALKSGSVLQCTEGVSYKVWILHPDSRKESIRRDYAEKFCSENNIVYGESKGGAYTEVRLKNKNHDRY